MPSYRKGIWSVKQVQPQQSETFTFGDVVAVAKSKCFGIVVAELILAPIP